MGREIEEMALKRGHTVHLTIDNEKDWDTHAVALGNADVAIEFSMPETAVQNIQRCFSMGIPVVSGTTGWQDRFEEVQQLCMDGKHSLFHASNFSPGMNMMFELNSRLASLMSRHGQYRILIEEIHHAEKKDSPSGTAITLAEEIIKHHPVKNKWVNRPSDGDHELEIISIRRNQVPGTHFVQYASELDELEIKHIAHSRKGFALGAVLAAEWLEGKKGVFGMKDMLNDTR